MIEHFDLGEYEIEAYLAVLENGELTASGVASRTDIPQPRVYDTVRELANHGLVELQETRPLRVVAVAPDAAFAEVRRSLDAMIDELTDLYTAPAHGAETVTLVQSHPTIERHLVATIEAATNELALAVFPDLLHRLVEPLSEAIDRGVTVDLLLNPNVEAPEPSAFDYAAVATTVRGRRGTTTPIIAVADERNAVFATQDAFHGDDEHYAVIFNHPALGFLVLGFFSTVLWSTADSIAEDDPVGSFPRRYRSVRRCVRDLERSSGPFHASVEGREVTTGEPKVVDGAVTEYTLDTHGVVANFTVDTGGGTVQVGGRAAAYEDIEAYEIEIRRGDDRADH